MKSDGIHFETVARAIRFIRENFKNQPDLAQIAAEVNMSKFHFQRLFTEWAGVSPKTFLQYTTMHHARALLEKGENTFNTALEVGLSGTGRLHDLFLNLEAVTPGEYKAMYDKVPIRYQLLPSSLGPALAAESPHGICFLQFVDNAKVSAEQLLATYFPHACIKESPGNYTNALRHFFNSWQLEGRDIKLSLTGTPFQVKVWQALLNIQPGSLVSYSSLAHSTGKPAAVRAVASAVGKNPIACLIPCHRVIRSSGEFGGYRWGLDRKAALIAFESISQYAKLQ